MNTVTLHFKADNQQLTALDGLYKLASNTVEYVKAIFTLGENWAGFDVVRAAWYTDFECISTVLDGNGECFVPWEVLSRPEGVTINLYGCDLEEESDGEAVLVDRLTTYPVKAILVDVDARVCGSETKPVTPSQFEQYIAIVQELVGTVRDITSCVLNPDYTLTINYSDDTSDTVGPIRGEQGEQGPTGPAGNGISKIEKISTAGLVDTYRITFTNGTHKDYTVTNGAKGDTGNGIESIYLTGTSGAVKTYTILFTNGNTFEYQVTDGEVTNAVFEQAFPTDTASGAIASFPDGSNLFPLKKCEVTLEPIQDLSHGDPSPSNICPISGWSEVGVTDCGKNWFTDENATDGTFVNYLGIVSPAIGWKLSDYIPVIPLTTYHFKPNSSEGDSAKLACYDRSKTFIGYFNSGERTFTTQSNCFFMRFSYRDSSTNIQLELGSTATTYTPYNGTTTTIPLGTTVYGGVVDCVSGDGKSKMKMLDLGTFNWLPSSRGCFYGALSDSAERKNNASNTYANIICEGYKTCTNKEGYDCSVDGAISIAFWNNEPMLSITDSRYGYNDVNAFKASLDGIYACYEVVTPTEIQLTPTQISILKGQNNIFSDGQINATYKADTQLWVEKKLGQ